MNELVAKIKSRFDHAAAKKILKEKYEAKMIFPYRGGLFRAGPELLSLLTTCSTDDVVIVDLYETPVMISPHELKLEAFNRWQEQMNAWFVEWTELQKQR